MVVGRSPTQTATAPPVLPARELRGLGDMVSKLASLFAIAPCEGCRRRAELLNSAVPFGQQTSPDDAAPRVRARSVGTAIQATALRDRLLLLGAVTLVAMVLVATAAAVRGSWWDDGAAPGLMVVGACAASVGCFAGGSALAALGAACAGGEPACAMHCARLNAALAAAVVVSAFLASAAVATIIIGAGAPLGLVAATLALAPLIAAWTMIRYSALAACHATLRPSTSPSNTNMTDMGG